MPEKKKAKSFGTPSAVKAAAERQEKIDRLLDRFETEFKVFQIRRKEDPRGLVRSMEDMLWSLFPAYRFQGGDISEIVERVSDDRIFRDSAEG